MGPKKAKGKGKKDTMIGAYPVEEMTVAELQTYALKLKEELDRSMMETEHYAIEVDRIRGFWDKTKQEIERKNKELVAKKAELEDLKIVYDQLARERDSKIEFSHREDHHKIIDKIVQYDLDRVNYEEENLKQETLAKDRVQRMKFESQKLRVTYDDVQQELRRARCKELSELITFCERRFNQLFQKYEEVFSTLWNDINCQRLKLVREAEDSKTKVMREAADQRDREFQDMRDYFNRVAFDCLSLIEEQKKQLEHLKKSEREQKNLLEETLNENRFLKGLAAEVAASEIELEPYERDKKAFAKARRQMQNLMTKIKDLEFENHMLSHKYQNVANQKKKLEERFFEAARKLQCSISLKNVFLQRKAAVLQDLLKKEVTKLNEGSPKRPLTLSGPHKNHESSDQQSGAKQRPKEEACRAVNIVKIEFPAVKAPFFPMK